MLVPDLAEVLAARRRIEPYLRPTPLYRYPALDATAGTRVWVKHENHQPVGAFKVRGGVNLATRTAFELPQQIMRDLLDDFVLVTEATLRDATRLMIEKTRNLLRRQHQPGPARHAPRLRPSPEA